MASPLAAGSVALIRQYFTDGYYPLGIKNTQNAFQPTGALLKAVLINGASPMTGFNSDGIPLEPPPSCRQGWGRIHVAASIRLPTANHEMIVLQNESFTTTAQRKGVCFMVNGTEEALKATLTWYDPAPSVVSDGTIVNDLDMIVTFVTGKKQIWPILGHQDRVKQCQKNGMELTQERDILRAGHCLQNTNLAELCASDHRKNC